MEDCNYLLDYYRLTADNRLLYGGGVVYGARDPDDVERLVVPKLLKTFPQLKGVQNRLPLDGQLPADPVAYAAVWSPRYQHLLHAGLQRPRRDLYPSQPGV